MTEQITQYVNVEIDSGVAVLTVDRPPLNILDISLLKQLEQALDDLSTNADVRVLQLQTAGKMFSAGVDIADHTAERVGEMIPLFNRVCQKVVDFPLPTLALVHGHALGGGCELVLCCDLVVIAEDAKIGQPEIQLAAFAPIAALRLPQLVGFRVAAHMMFTGFNLSAEEALRVGLVNAVVPADKLSAWAQEQTMHLSSLSRAAQTLNKRALRKGYSSWEKALPEIEKLYLHELIKTSDALEGMNAFQEKRAPQWKHK